MKTSKSIWSRLILLLFFHTTIGLSQVTEESVVFHDYHVSDILIDDNNNLYKTGYISNGVASNVHTVIYNSSGNIIWNAQYDGNTGYGAGGEILFVDQFENVFVGGHISYYNSGFKSKIIVLKYDSNGDLVWDNTYLNCQFGDMTLDNNSNVYIVGGYDSDRFATIKYDSDGGQLWAREYNDGKHAYAITLDNLFNIYVTGNDENGMMLIKYDTDGNEQWMANDTSYAGLDIVSDINNNIYLVAEHRYEIGFHDYDYLVVYKYDSDGNLLWKNSYQNNEQPYTISDNAEIRIHNDQLYVAGIINRMSGTESDIIILKYDSEGNIIWENIYDGPEHRSEWLGDMVVDEHGNVYITGSSEGTRFTFAEDCCTIKYDNNGYFIWDITYNGEENSQDIAFAIDIDSNYNIYISGRANFMSNYITIKYSQVQEPFPPNLVEPLDNQNLDADSVLFIWNHSIPTIDKYCLEISTNTKFTNSFIDSNITDTTIVKGGFSSNQDYYWRVKAHNFIGWSDFSDVNEFNIIGSSIQTNEQNINDYNLSPNYPNPFNSSTSISFSIPQKDFVVLKIFNISGQEIDTIIECDMARGRYNIDWSPNNLPSGIYLYQLKTKKFIEIKKLTLLK